MKEQLQKLGTRIYGETRCPKCQRRLLWEHIFSQNVAKILYADVHILNPKFHYAKIKKILNPNKFLFEVTCKYCNNTHEFNYHCD